MSLDLSPNEERQLASALGALDLSATDMVALADASPRELFCRYWPITRQLLAMMRDMPAASPPVRAALTVSIAAGDATSRLVC